jgi:hypothetical protein
VSDRAAFAQLLRQRLDPLAAIPPASARTRRDSDLNPDWDNCLGTRPAAVLAPIIKRQWLDHALHRAR